MTGSDDPRRPRPTASASAPCPSGTSPTSTPRPTRPEIAARPRLARRRVPRPSPPTTRAGSPTLDAAGLLGADPPLGAHPDGLRPHRQLRRPALLPEHHRPASAPSSSATCRPPSPTPRRRWSSSPSSSTALDDAALDATVAADADARPLQAGARPHPQDEAAPALRRARAVPARPVGGRRRRLEPAVRRDHGRPALRRSAARPCRSRRRSTCSPTTTAPAARPAPRRWPRCSRRNLPLFARITNTLAKEKEIEDRWRKLPTPQAGRHLANDVEPEVVQALRDAVVAAYPRLSHRYYALKARWLGLDKLQIWDRNAPLPQRRRPQDPLGRGARDRARRLRRLRPAHGRARRAVLRAAAGSTPR